MIIKTSNGQSFDTNEDLLAVERHVLQKLFAWETMAESVDQFREKKKEALKKGWNNSGPITESKTFKIIAKDMEKKVIARLNSRKKL